MQSRIGNLLDLDRRTLRMPWRIWPILLVIGACGLAAGQFGLGARPVSLSPQCAAWDVAASTVLAGLIADPSENAEAQLGDAVFRLRRARRNCRHDWVGLARLDYDALIDGRYGLSR